MRATAPLALIILDGWGVAKPSAGNAISLAKTPVFLGLERQYPTMTLEASGIAVGLMWGVVGNSETGHLNLGAGRVVYQQLPRIVHEIQTGRFFLNPALRQATAWVKTRSSTLHVAGLFSSGTVHSFVDHLYALLDFAQREGVPRVILHLWLDGRDSPIHEGKKALENLTLRLESTHFGHIGTIMGRSFAMDRNGNWERTFRAYHCMTLGQGRQVTDLPAYLQASYDLGLTDEFIEPAALVSAQGVPVGLVQPGDALIFFNFRAERMRQITEAFALPNFAHFRRPPVPDLQVVTLTEYEPELTVPVAFRAENLNHTLAAVVSQAGLRQLHIAETEKYAHVTYFFNGRREDPVTGEERILIPSHRHASFDAAPEMQAPEIGNRVVEALAERRFDFFVVNFANADMVGHTGNIVATAVAIAAVDQAVGRIVEAVLGRGGTVVITADHGNAEEMINLRTGQPRREHTANPVPVYVVAKRWQRKTAPTLPLFAQKPAGRLADVAPTILELLGIKPPVVMTGTSLLRKRAG